MAQWLGARVVLPENSSFIPCTPVRLLQNHQLQEINSLLATVGTCTLHIHVIKNKHNKS